MSAEVAQPPDMLPVWFVAPRMVRRRRYAELLWRRGTWTKCCAREYLLVVAISDWDPAQLGELR